MKKASFVIILCLSFISELSAETAQCTALGGLMKDVHKKELAIEGTCKKADGKDGPCSLLDMQKEYNELQAQNIIYGGLMNLIRAIKANIKNLHEAPGKIQASINSLNGLENGTIAINTIKNFCEAGAAMENLKDSSKEDNSDLLVLEGVKKEFCSSSKIASNEDLCKKINAAEYDGKGNLTQKTIASYSGGSSLPTIVGYLKAYFKMSIDRRRGADSVVALTIANNASNLMPVKDVVSLKNQAMELNKKVECVDKILAQAGRNPTGAPVPGTNAQSINIVDPNTNPLWNSNILNKPKIEVDQKNNPTFTEVAGGKDIDISCMPPGAVASKYQADVQKEMDDYANKLKENIGKIDRSNAGEFAAFDLIQKTLNSNYFKEDRYNTLKSNMVCFNEVAGCAKPLYEGLTGQTAAPTSQDYDTAYNNLYGSSMDDAIKYIKTNSYLQGLSPSGASNCNGAGAEDCYMNLLLAEYKKFSANECKTIEKNDLKNNHLKTNACLEKITDDEIDRKMVANNARLAQLKNSLDAVYSKQEYKDTNYTKQIIFWNWKKADCGTERYQELPANYCSKAGTPGTLPGLKLFVDDAQNVMGFMNSHEFGLESANRIKEKITDVEFIKKDFICNGSVKNLPNLERFCTSSNANVKNYAGIDDQSNSRKPSTDATGGTTPTTPATDTDNDKTGNKKTTKQSGTTYTNNTDNDAQGGTGMTTGEGIGSGLIGALGYGMQTLQEYRNNQRFAQGMMQNAFTVRNAELNPPYLYRRFPQYPPQQQTPYLWTGAPWGSYDAMSTTFNYDNNALYYNTYDPTKGQTNSYRDNGYNFQGNLPGNT